MQIPNAIFGSMIEPVVALFIPIIAIIFGVGIGMLALYLGYRKRKELFVLYHQERMAALEKGVDLPPLPDALFSEEARPSDPRRHLLKGLVWLFTGIGLGVALWATTELGFALFGLIPIGIGLAHLIYYFVEGKSQAAAMDQRAIPPARPATVS